MYNTVNDPFEHLTALRDRVNRLFDASSTRGGAAEADGEESGWSPLVDLYETGDNVVLVAEVPGLSMDDLDVKVTESTLTVKGQRSGVAASDDGKLAEHRLERAHGAFSRTFQLTSAIDREKVTAEYRLGLLTVVLPKKRARPQTIRVS